MPHFPSPTSVFIPDHEASNKMVVDFARNVKKFAVNKYVQVVPVKKIAGYYMAMTIEEAGRVRFTNLRDRVWHDGQPASEGNENTESFNFLPFLAKRYHYPFTLGDLTIDQASWDIMAQHASIMARAAMTSRTQLVITEATTTGNYDATHVLDVTTISGNSGNWAASTTARGDIKRSLFAMAEIILDDTLAAIDLNDLMLVINSSLASQMAQSQEVVDYIKGSPDALAQIRGELPGENVMYGLPNKLYGFPIIVEATRKVTSQKGQTRAVSQVLATGTPFMASRPGALEGVANAPNFSTLTVFAQEEMTVETKRDVDNRRTSGRVVDTITAKVTASASGGMFQNAA